MTTTPLNAQGPGGALSKLVGIAVGAVFLVLAFMLSIVAFAVVAGVGSVAAAYLWWKTRDLRRRLRERPPGGLVIDGVAVRESTVPDAVLRDPSREP